MNINAGSILVDSPLGTLHVDRDITPTQAELVAAAITAVGWTPRNVAAVSLVEGHAIVTGYDLDDPNPAPLVRFADLQRQPTTEGGDQ